MWKAVFIKVANPSVIIDITWCTHHVLKAACSGVSQQQMKPVLVWCWANVVDGGTTLNQHRHSVSCLLGGQVSTLCRVKVGPVPATLNQF